MDTNDKIKIALAIFVAGLVLFIIYRIMGKIGLVKSAESEKKDESIYNLRTMKEFNPNYYKNRSFAALGKGVSDSYAKDIKKSLGLITDNEELIYSTFAQLKNKTNISEIAESFKSMYKKDLRSFLLSYLSKNEMQKLNDIINKLPNF